MDWLDTYGSLVNCKSNSLKLTMPDGMKVVIQGDRPSKIRNVISMMKVRKYIHKGSESFLLFPINEVEEKKIQDVLSVAEYLDVFPENLPGLPPDCQVEFLIESVYGTAPIVEAPYRLAPP